MIWRLGDCLSVCHQSQNAIWQCSILTPQFHPTPPTPKRSENTTNGKTRCINTFKGFSCECGAGFMRVVDKDTNEESCAQVNQCLMSGLTANNADCKCDRCVCNIVPGGYK
jgi:hypothetical protein